MTVTLVKKRSTAVETDIIIEPSKSDPGEWYWAFTIDGEVNADGSEEWEHRNDD